MLSPAIKSLRALADPTRLRILHLLQRQELSVNELQEITRLGQSRISTHLGLLQDSGLVESRRDGKRTFYRVNPDAGDLSRQLLEPAIQCAAELPECAADLVNLKRLLASRLNHAQLLFNQVAGRFDRSYGPGRSWQALGQLLLRLVPPITIADLGAGEGLISELLALRAKKVIAVDNSEKIIAFGAHKAQSNGIDNLEFRLGDLEDPPIDPDSIDLVLLTQALHHAADPKRALASAFKILKPGGQLMILDLLKHNFEQAHSLYGDLWLGFAESDLHQWLEGAQFQDIEIQLVAREEQPPHFQTLLAGARKSLANGAPLSHKKSKARRREKSLSV